MPSDDEPGDEGDLEGLMARQAWQAVSEADLVLFMVDARDGLTALDETLAAALRRTQRQTETPPRIEVGEVVVEPDRVAGAAEAAGVAEDVGLRRLHALELAGAPGVAAWAREVRLRP